MWKSLKRHWYLRQDCYSYLCVKPLDSISTESATFCQLRPTRPFYVSRYIFVKAHLIFIQDSNAKCWIKVGNVFVFGVSLSLATCCDQIKVWKHWANFPRELHKKAPTQGEAGKGNWSSDLKKDPTGSIKTNAKLLGLVSYERVCFKIFLASTGVNCQLESLKKRLLWQKNLFRDVPFWWSPRCAAW